METQVGAVAPNGPLPATDRRKLEFSYDGQSRRIGKKVSNWDGTTWVVSSNVVFLYDGWNLIAEMDALNSNAVVRTYVWGLDLSGSMQGAGGVGGLLSVTNSGATYAPAFDGNGNVIGLVDMATGTKSATYDYNALGETIQNEGVAALANPFRFSTKYTDDETGLLYYGYRYYQPSTGRWLSKDPIEEAGGVNLYGFLGNSAVHAVDRLGLDLLAPSPVKPGYLNAGPRPFPKPPGVTGALGAIAEGAGLFFTLTNSMGDATISGREESAMMQKLCEKCKFVWGQGDRGGHPGHTRYLQRKFGFNVRNVTVITPEGDAAGYDAGTPDNGGQFDEPTTVYEVKTGYKFAANDLWSTMQSQWMFSNTFQFAQQAKVAARCKLSYRIMFSDENGYLGHLRNLPELGDFMQHEPW
jgi:RHS repeat-associated protein